VSAEACAALQGFTDLMAAFMVGCFGAGCCLGSFVGGAIGARHWLSADILQIYGSRPSYLFVLFWSQSAADYRSFRTLGEGGGAAPYMLQIGSCHVLAGCCCACRDQEVRAAYIYAAEQATRTACPAGRLMMVGTWAWLRISAVPSCAAAGGA
jgi:hypothetical protein